MIRRTGHDVERKITIDRRRALRTGGMLAGLMAALNSASLHVTANVLSPKRQANDQGVSEMAYEIEGRLLEVCTCNILCPCWVGEDPDGGTCDSSFAWQIDKGTIEGIDVSGRTVALSVHIPGNVLAGNWRAVVYLDDKTSDEQEEALLKVFTGQLGGAIADLAGLISEVIAVERAPINFAVEEGKGTLTIGEVVDAELAPFQGATGTATALHDTAFTTIPGSPAYVGKAAHYRRDGAQHGLADVDIEGHNAIQGLFHFSA